MLILGMGIGGWIATVAASSGSLPGEWLYPAKIATEKTQVVMANVVGDKNTEQICMLNLPRGALLKPKR